MSKLGVARAALAAVAVLSSLPTPAQTCGVQYACQVDLWYRPVVRMGVYLADHSFWHMTVTDTSTEDTVLESVVDGGPSGDSSPSAPLGYLTGWETQGPVGHYPEDDVRTANFAWQSASTCYSVGALDGYPAIYTGLPKVAYNFLGPNSNTFVHQAGNYAGYIQVPKPSASCVGW